MLRNLLFALAVICFLQNPQAQILLPYLGKNGLTGFADTAGRLVISPQFTDVEGYFKSQDAAVRAKKDGQIVLVLRNGAVVADAENKGRAQFALNARSLGSGSAYDTLRELAVVAFREKQVLVNTRTGKQVEFQFDPSNGLRSWFPVDVQPVPKNNGYAGLFLKGVMRVGRPGGMLNYLDTALNLVFRDDFPAGTFIPPNTFFVANTDHKIAIADSTGRMRSPFKFELLVPSGRPGFFISDPPVYGFSPTKKGQVGLIDANGKYIIEPKMDDIRSASDQFLIFKKGNGEGVMDFSGQILLPPIDDVSLKFAVGELFILTKNKRQQLINLKGENHVPGDFVRLTWFEKNRAFPAHFHFTGDPVSGAFAPDGKLIFRDSFNTVERLDGSEKSLFKTHLLQKGDKTLVGLMDFAGKEVVPRQFESIEMRWGVDILLVKKGGLSGYKNYDGQDILPCRFEEVDLRSFAEGVRLFGREKGQNRWLAFDLSGKRVPENDCLHPTEKAETLFFIPNLWNNPTRIVFRDGSEAAIPKRWPPMGKLRAYNSPAGIFVLSEEPGGWDLYDKKMQPLLPPGFVMPRRELNGQTIGITGLLPVWQQNLKAIAILAPPVEETTTRPQPAVQEMEPSGEVPPPTLDVQIVEEPPQLEMAPETIEGDFFIGGGVLNGRGEWVIKPTENALFLPISWNLVLEYALIGTEAKRLNPRRMHRVNHPKPAVFEVSGADFYGEIERGNLRVYQSVDNPDRPNYKHTFQTWFSTTGEQLAPFKFSAGPSFLKNRNAVRAVENGKPVWLIVDEKCRTIATLDGLDDAGPGTAWYFKNGMMTATKGGKFGLIDSSGRAVLPFQFGKLSLLENGRFLSEEVVFSEKYRLLDWQGNVLGEAKTRPESRVDEKMGIIMVFLDARTAIFSPDGRRIGEVNGRNPEWTFVAERPGFIRFLDEQNRKFWVDLTTAREFREK
jgi:WG containing repeat